MMFSMRYGGPWHPWGESVPVWTRLALVMALTAAFLTLLANFIRSGRPAALDAVAGTITPEKISACVTVVVGAGMAIAGGWAVLTHHGDWSAVAVAFVGVAIAGFMAPSLTHVHDVQWTADVVEGPSRLFGPTLGSARTSIAWRDVAQFGVTVTGYWYVEARDGRRVYWSYLYKGNEALAASIRARCPELRRASC
jgi:hypothetical protein